MPGMYGRLALYALTRPWHLPLLVSTAWAFRARSWYRRAPFLPLPSQAYLMWRLETAYGDASGDPPMEDLLRYLKWAREMRRHMRR